MESKYDPDEFFSAERPVTLKYAQRIQEQYSWQDDVLKVTTGIVHEMDKRRELEICNHFDCDLSEFREWLAKKQKQTRQTNADRIRAMSDRELAAWCGRDCPKGRFAREDETEGVCSKFDNCAACWLDWLKEEVE